MSTAARPTFHAAKGKSSFGSGTFTRLVSAKDQLAHTKLKFRQYGQFSTAEMASKNLKESLTGKEQSLLTNSNEPVYKEPYLLKEKSAIKLLKNEATVTNIDIDEIKRKYDDEDANNSQDGFDSSGDEDEESINSGDNDDDDDDEEDDELELQMELDRIKAERAAAQMKKEMEERELEERSKKESALKSNPLVDLSEFSRSNNDAGSAKLKRRWNDDVVFKNQARDEPEKKKASFINDTIRNDFHRSFLKKYMK